MGAITRLIKYSREIVDIDAITEIGCQSYELGIKNNLPHSPTEDVALARLELQEDIEEVEEAINKLNKEEQEIIRGRFVKNESFEVIGYRLNISKNIAIEIRNSAITKLDRILT